MRFHRRGGPPPLLPVLTCGKRRGLRPRTLRNVKSRSSGAPVMVAAIVAAGLGGCAGAPLGRSVEQDMRVEVPGCPPMRCELRNDLGRWVVDATPGHATVRTSATPLEVGCGTTDLPPGTERLASSQPSPSAGAAAVGAAVGAGVGAAATAPAMAIGGPFGFLAATVVVVGAVGGGALAQAADARTREYRYPGVVVVPMVCPQPPPDAAALAGARWGLAVRGATPGDGAPDGAVWVLAVAPQGRAAAAGLRAGDLLLALDALPLAGTLQLQDALDRAVRERAQVTLQVRRGGTLTTLTLAMDASR